MSQKTNSNKGQVQIKKTCGNPVLCDLFWDGKKWPSKDKWPPTITDKKVTNWITWEGCFLFNDRVIDGHSWWCVKAPLHEAFWLKCQILQKVYMFNILVHLFHSKCLFFLFAILCHMFFSVRILNSVLILDCQLLSVLHNLSVFAWKNLGGFQPKIT